MEHPLQIFDLLIIRPGDGEGGEAEGQFLVGAFLRRGKADDTYPVVSAASILAKVTRDRWMLELDRRFPQYGFAAHKGYGTKAHYAALREYGPCEAHRPTYLRKMH